MELIIKYIAEKELPWLRKPNEQFPWQHDGFVHNNSTKQEVFIFHVVTFFWDFDAVHINIDTAVSYVSSGSSHTVGDTICLQRADTSLSKLSQKWKCQGQGLYRAVLGYTWVCVRKKICGACWGTHYFVWWDRSWLFKKGIGKEYIYWWCLYHELWHNYYNVKPNKHCYSLISHSTFYMFPVLRAHHHIWL